MKHIKFIGADKATVELHDKQPFDWELWKRQQAANEQGIPLEEVPDPDDDAGSPERNWEED